MTGVLDDQVESIDGIPMPKKLAHALRTRVVRYEPEQPGLGVSASYLSGFYTIGLYIYDGLVNDIPEDPMHPIVTAHLQHSVSEAISAATTRDEKLVCTGAYGVPYAGTSVDYLVAKLSLEQDEGRLSSLILLTTSSRRFVKLRISFREPSLSAEGMGKTIGAQYFSLLWPDLRLSARPIPPVGM